MSKPRFQFGNVVVVENVQIGVICKTWQDKQSYHYEVYVRNFNKINDYSEENISHFVYSKILEPEEMEFYK